jgi:hypothetical protein
MVWKEQWVLWYRPESCTSFSLKCVPCFQALLYEMSFGKLDTLFVYGWSCFQALWAKLSCLGKGGSWLILKWSICLNSDRCLSITINMRHGSSLSFPVPWIHVLCLFPKHLGSNLLKLILLSPYLNIHSYVQESRPIVASDISSCWVCPSSQLSAPFSECISLGRHLRGYPQ